MPIPMSVARFNRRVTNRITGRVAGRLPGFGILRHVGRTSGRDYEIPINIFRDGDEYVIVLTYGPNTDWVKNVLAAGGCEVVIRGRRVRLTGPHIVTDTAMRWAPPLLIPFARIIFAAAGVTQVMRLSRVG